jgi:hypothetical protein
VLHRKRAELLDGRGVRKLCRERARRGGEEERHRGAEGGGPHGEAAVLDEPRREDHCHAENEEPVPQEHDGLPGIPRDREDRHLASLLDVIAALEEAEAAV